MTRVAKQWLGSHELGSIGMQVTVTLSTGESVEDAIWSVHLPHHLGVDQTLDLA